MTEELTNVEKQALKWLAIDSWIRRNRSGGQYTTAQDLWFAMLKFYDGLRDD